MSAEKRMAHIKDSDSEIFTVLEKEIKRQENGAEMIASENFVSRAVMQATGSVLTNKYSEGYPSKRYYGGNEFIDISEDLARERAKKLFGADHANVQPHAGSQANMEAYFALLELKDKILALDLGCGGHLTHGHPVNFSAQFYTFSHYIVDKKTGILNMDYVRKEAEKVRPKMLLSGFSAYPRKMDFKEFGEIAKDIGAYHLADVAHIAGLIAGGVHQNPVPFSDVVTTTTHKTLRGPRGAMILCKEEHAKAIDKAVFPGMQGGPLEHVIAAKAVAFGEALQPEFKEYATQVVKNAGVLAESLMSNGLDLVTNGTDNHLMMIDLTKLGIGGKQAETALDEANLFTNKNMIPFDKRSPFDPSGIRLGTAALTTRGFKEGDMKIIGETVAKVLHNVDDEGVKKKAKEKVLELCGKHPLYPELRVC